MTYNEFNIKIARDEVLGRLLPMQVKRTYPLFSLEGSALLASFAGFRLAPAPGGVRAFAPAYYLKISYPRCTLYSYERLAGKAGDPEGHLLEPKSPDDIKRLAALCDEVFRLYDEKADGLAEKIEEYNGLLRALIEPDQLAVLEKYR